MFAGERRFICIDSKINRRRESSVRDRDFINAVSHRHHLRWFYSENKLVIDLEIDDLEEKRKLK